MHVLLAIALVLVLVGVLLVVAGLVRKVASGRAGLPLRIGLGALACSVVIALSLAYAQPQVCSLLGGRWSASELGCANELGGNGTNDPSNNADDAWPWTESFPEANWFEARWADIKGNPTTETRALILAPRRLRPPFRR